MWATLGGTGTGSPASAFKTALLKTRRAVIRVKYNNGRVEEQIWRAERMSANSNVIGNLRSRPAFRAGTWQRRGISCVAFRLGWHVARI